MNRNATKSAPASAEAASFLHPRRSPSCQTATTSSTNAENQTGSATLAREPTQDYTRTRCCQAKCRLVSRHRAGSPRDAARLSSLEQDEVLLHLIPHVRIASRHFGCPDRLALPRDGLPVVAGFCVRHRHRFTLLGSGLLLLNDVLHDRDGAPAVADGRIGRGGQNTDQRLADVGMIRVRLARFRQPVARLTVVAQRRRAPATARAWRRSIAGRAPARDRSAPTRPSGARYGAACRRGAALPRHSPARTSPPRKAVRSPLGAARPKPSRRPGCSVRARSLERASARLRTAPARPGHRRRETVRSPADGEVTRNPAPLRAPAGSSSLPSRGHRPRAPRSRAIRMPAALLSIPRTSLIEGIGERHVRPTATLQVKLSLCGVAETPIRKTQRVVDGRRTRFDGQRRFEELHRSGVVPPGQRHATEAGERRGRRRLERARLREAWFGRVRPILRQISFPSHISVGTSSGRSRTASSNAAIDRSVAPCALYKWPR